MHASVKLKRRAKAALDLWLVASSWNALTWADASIDCKSILSVAKLSAPPSTQPSDLRTGYASHVIQLI